jgi:hypothetical protein
MTDREQLKRDCSDALHAIQHDKGVDGIAALADAIRGLGSTYRSHGELMQVALRDRNDNAITWHLIHVLESWRRRRRREAPPARVFE